MAIVPVHAPNVARRAFASRAVRVVVALALYCIGAAVLLTGSAFYTWSYHAFAPGVIVMAFGAFVLTSVTVSPRRRRPRRKSAA